MPACLACAEFFQLEHGANLRPSPIRSPPSAASGWGALAQPVVFQDWQLVRSKFRGFGRRGARRSFKACGFEWRFLFGRLQAAIERQHGQARATQGLAAQQHTGGTPRRGNILGALHAGVLLRSAPDQVHCPRAPSPAPELLHQCSTTLRRLTKVPDR